MYFLIVIPSSEVHFILMDLFVPSYFNCTYLAFYVSSESDALTNITLRFVDLHDDILQSINFILTTWEFTPLGIHSSELNASSSAVGSYQL